MLKRRAPTQGPGSAFKKPRPSIQRQPSIMMADFNRGGGGGRRQLTLAPEKKFNDSSSTVDSTTTAVVVNLNTMAAGDTALLRDGNKILTTSVQIRATIRNESATISTVNRILVVHDKNSNGTAPTAAQVFEGTPGVTSLKSISNASRFTTLLDKTFVNNSDGSFNYTYINEYVKVPQALQLTSFADGTAAVPISGSLSLIYIGSEAAGVADTDVILQARCRFIG